MPRTIPQASAMTFFTAPPSSQPTTSRLVYGRKYPVAAACCTSTARSMSRQATTVAVGCSRTISPARLGPVSTAMRSAGAPVTSAITSLIRLALPSSTPFIRLTRVASGGRNRAHAARLARSDWAGTASATTPAPATAAAGSAVALIAAGRATPPR
jgi:hypothetical protein